MNKKLGLLLAVGALILSACGNDGNQASEEQNDVAEETPVAEQEENTEEAANEEDTDAVEETEEAEEEKAEEEAPAATDVPEAMSGEASELLSEGDSTIFVFNQTGEFSIFCEPHPVMKMTVIVEEGAENSGEVALDIADYEFSEETITVAPGTTITWTNQDLAQHNVAFE
ncbi:plastocyanin/azurin family copper-binding protein [Planomicrobium okeanokoites]|uniref:plastocyanin/azurin family copper-binding protein n=1 Tax=Planomicrobium okeanokoites TaxID=244 RepID=UPI002490F4E6|nr:plastocyanin/azurin family copper-binding protein [Planomicrobium okeanokoites]